MHADYFYCGVRGVFNVNLLHGVASFFVFAMSEKFLRTIDEQIHSEFSACLTNSIIRRT